MFGGRLGQLDLDHRIGKTFACMDLGRMRWAAGVLDLEGKLSKLMPISARMGSTARCQHVSCDAHLGVMLLSIYWHRPADHSGQHPLMHMCLDTIYEAQNLPGGLDLEVERFKIYQDEEKMRDAIGRSVWRLSLDMNQILTMLEGSTKTNKVTQICWRKV